VGNNKILEIAEENSSPYYLVKGTGGTSLEDI
jgi:hypothetical protein